MLSYVAFNITQQCPSDHPQGRIHEEALRLDEGGPHLSQRRLTPKEIRTDACSGGVSRPRDATKTALSGPYGRPEALAKPSDPSASPNPGRTGPVPEESGPWSPENPAAEAARNPSPYLYPSEKIRPDSTTTHSNPYTSTPKPDPPAPPYGPTLLQGDRHALESVIGLSESVIGIVGMRRGSVRHRDRNGWAHERHALAHAGRLVGTVEFILRDADGDMAGVAGGAHR